MTRLTIKALQKLRDDGVKIAVLTCYDASFAAMLDAAGLDSLLVGDSLGMVLQGHDTTLPVTLADMAYHTRCVAHGSKRAFLITDMPFGSYQESPQQAFRSAAELMAAGAGLLVLEAIPAKLGEQATQRLRIPTIGIGAGAGCSGQVLVLHDMLDVFPGKKARFVRNFMKGASSISDAAERYVRAVRDGSFPSEEHSF